MSISRRLIFIHGLYGSSQGVKARLLREIFPDILTPEFSGSLEERMASLEAILGDQDGWRLIGSSFGGLMATIFACQHPQQVEKLILLAPALIWPDFTRSLPEPISVPTVIYHGRRDEIIPLEAAQEIARRIFTTLDFRPVDDEHGLYQTIHTIDWAALVDN